MIGFERVSVAFGAQLALRDVSLEVPAGAITVVFGPNAAGKSTLLHTAAGLLHPRSGNTIVSGIDVAARPNAVRRLVGLLPHQTLLYPHLSARENLLFYARLYGLPDPPLRVAHVIDQLGLDRQADRRLGRLSRGLAQRVAIGRAILHAPHVLLLDEPFTALDLSSAARLEDLLVSQRDAGRTVLVAMHDLGRGLRLADRVAVLSAGRLTYRAARGAVDVTQVTNAYEPGP
jgi:ABC-type multidrug transport system ATPase subunit